MKAAVIYEAGGPDKFIIEERPLPKLKEGWTLVKVLGFGVNHSEIFTRKGLSPSVSFPRVLGIECVGQVLETTSDNLEVGQQVISIMGEMGRAFNGSYADHVLLPNQQVYAVTSKLPLEELVAVPETYYTAYGAFKNLQIKASDQVLVRGATSSVGLAFMKLVKAKFKDVKVYGSSRKLDKKDKLLAAGFDGVILDKNNQLETQLSFDKILELVGPASIKDSFDHIKENGIVCSNGQLGGIWNLQDFDPIVELKNNSYLASFYSGQVNQTLLQEMLDYLDQYQVPVQPEKIFSLDDIAQAHAYLESDHSFGKVIVLN